MHILGKILTWLLVPLAFCAIVLAATMVKYRGSWLQKIEAETARNHELAAKLAIAEAAVRARENELAVATLGWDRYWNLPGADVGINPDGSAGVRNLGTAMGFVLPAAQGGQTPVAYIFRQDGPQGDAHYIGEFQPVPGGLRENELGLVLARRARPNEAARWRQTVADGFWRIRTLIPAAYANSFADMYTEFNRADENLAAKQKSLELQEQLYRVAQEHLSYRLQELLGPPNPPANLDPADKFPEFKIGLLASIDREEELRDLALAELDRLRRQVKAANDRFQFLIDDNRARMDQLIRATALRTAQSGGN